MSPTGSTRTSSGDLRNEDALADPDTGNLAFGDRFVGEGAGDAKRTGRFLDGEGEALDRLVRDRLADLMLESAGDGSTEP
jgi:hypothetical protein